MNKDKVFLNELLKDVEIISVSGDLRVEVSGVHMDSRRIEPGNCFVAVSGFKEDGLNYAADAVKKGAVAIVSTTKPGKEFKNITWVQVNNERIALSKMAASFYRNITHSMYVTGITGTNGKTTIMSLIHAIFSRQFKTAKIGTLGMYFDEVVERTSLTTPESIDLFKFFSKVYRQGCRDVVMEVSSVSLKLHRVDDIRFSQGIFTTFSGDHLDFHQTMEDYFQSKMLLFNKLTMDDWAVINIDDPAALKIIDQLDCRYLTYGFDEDADIRPLKYKFSLEGTRTTLQTPKGDIELKSLLVGRVNLLNIMAAVTSAIIRGVTMENIAAALSDFKPVKGRLDPVYKGKFSVLIDYAHTDKALEELLRSLREIVSNNLILVFGAGGGRDKTKRPRMGKVASQHADIVVVTSDNPRNEEPMDIVDDVIHGFVPGLKNFSVEVDRKKAIEKALSTAAEGDLVVIAGKGHEDYQIFKDKTIHFDDYEVVQEFLEKKCS